MKIPPVLAIVIAIVIGITIGAYGMKIKTENNQLKVDNKQKKIDNKIAKKIEIETISIIEKSKIPKAIKDYKDKGKKIKEKVKYITKELTNEEIDTMCVNRNVPDHILQLVRDQISRARERINNVQTNRSP